MSRRSATWCFRLPRTRRHHRAGPHRVRERRIEQVMGQFPILREFRDRKAVELSGGQQSSWTRAHYIQPELINEPSIGLSPLVKEVFRTLQRLRDQGVGDC